MVAGNGDGWFRVGDVEWCEGDAQVEMRQFQVVQEQEERVLGSDIVAINCFRDCPRRLVDAFGPAQRFFSRQLSRLFVCCLVLFFVLDRKLARAVGLMCATFATSLNESYTSSSRNLTINSTS